MTSKLWEGYNSLDEYKSISFMQSHSFAVSVLDDDKIAILPNKNTLNDTDKSNLISDLAVIYRFKKEDYSKIKNKIKNVEISEILYISVKGKSVSASGGEFNITLTDGRLIRPIYVDTTLTKRSKNELIIDHDAVNFEREVFIDKRQTTDLSFLYRVPLTPLALSADLVMDVGMAAVSVVAVPALVVYFALACSLSRCN
ncbi:hypothetical protein [Zooshikella harenae]|uniref:Uncharacterized protein n=1 Tax=Zooshikella harenae TaxID=2827238 RepID=A0ABS5ZLN1_9GAMM|nr:hypothetical protein [Zooshikella harenae]MBU2714102.1 hypothetical protein [Zooshikella harenae]